VGIEMQKNNIYYIYIYIYIYIPIAIPIHGNVSAKTNDQKK